MDWLENEQSSIKLKDVCCQLYTLNKVEFQQFVALLDAPPVRNEKLHKLLTTQSPWDLDPDQDKLNPLG